MKSKTLLYISIIVVVLAAVWMLPRWFGKGEGVAVDLGLKSLSSENINYMSIEQQDKIVELGQASDGWRVGGFKADREKVQKIFDKLSEAKITGPVSRNQANHAKFEVTKDKGTKLTFKQGDSEIASFIIGKQAATYQTSYIRKSNEDQVFIADANLHLSLPTEINDWRDKTVVQIDRKQVKKVEFEYPDEKFALALQADNTWHAVDDQDIATTTEESLINRFFNNLNPLTANGFIEDAEDIEQFNIATSSSLVRFMSNNNEAVVELKLVGKDDNWLVQKTGDDIIYAVPKYRLADVLLKQEDIFKANQ